MDAFRLIAEQRIGAAVDRGELDGLPGRGEPLPLDRYRRSPAELRAAYTVLRNSGFVPEEVEVRRRLHGIDGLLAGADDPEEIAKLRAQRAALELRRDLAAERRR